MLGRAARVAQRSSSVVSSLSLSHTQRSLYQCVASLPLVWCHRRYSSTAAKASNEQGPQLDTMLGDSFKKYNITPSNSNVEVLKAYDMVRNAEALLTHHEDFDKAESMLMGTLDYIKRNNVTDQWVIGSAQVNLGYALQQSFKYDDAINNYTAGLQALSAEPVRDNRFLGLRQLTFAELMSLQGNHQAAASIAQNAVASLKKAVGEESELVGLAISNLASYKMLEGQPKVAVVHAERALKILEVVLGKHNDTTRNCAVNLVNIYKALQRTEDIEELDERYQKEDEPILRQQEGNFSQDYLNGLREKWRAQGPRKIFDPPGIHRSAALSAKSYQAFLKSWKARRPITKSEASVLDAELKSLGYSFDKLRPFTPRTEGLFDRVGEYLTGFEHLDIKGVTSLAKEMDKDAALPRPTKAEMTITPEEWRSAAARQREYRAKHGDPQRETVEDEFAESERQFNIEEEQQETTEINNTFDFLRPDHEFDDWDKDDYDLQLALFGDEHERAIERSKGRNNPLGEGEIPQDEEDTEEEEFEEDDEDGLELSDPHGVEYLDKLENQPNRPLEEHYSERDAPENFGTGPSGPNPTESVPRTKSSEKSDPYEHNPEEDDVFPDNETDRSQDRTAEELADDIRNENASKSKQKDPTYKYGRLHQTPWHEDNY